MPVNTPIIEVSHITFGYSNNLILDDLSFSIQKGKYVGIIGPNGGGKTTIIKLIVGLFKPDKGIIKINGVPLDKLEEKYKIGYVPQRVSQDNITFPAMVEEIVASGCTPQLPFFSFNKKHSETTETALDLAHVSHLRHHRISDLSGGERQRVYVARALAAQPELLILDEPFVGIDMPSQQSFYHLLKDLNDKQGLSILFVSHDIDVISDEADEIICLNRRLVCQDKPSNILESNMIEKLYGKRITHIHH